MTRPMTKKPTPKMGGEPFADCELTVAEASERVGMSVHTLRYYERAGLLPPVPRDANSRHRRYGPNELAALNFIHRMRGTGMPIRDLQRYMGLRQQGNSTADAREKMLEERRGAVLAQIAELQETLTVIEYKIATCRHIEPVGADTRSVSAPTKNHKETK